MALAQKNNYISPEDFLEIRRNSNDPMEYIDGEIVAMAGNSKAHGQIVSAITCRVDIALSDRPCESSLGITVAVAGAYLTPDLVVYCDGGNVTPDDKILRDPAAIFEVLSEPMTAYEHGTKWRKYQQIESLKHYVIVWQNEPIIEVYTRRSERGWIYRSALGLDGRIELPYLDLNLALSDIYANVEICGTLAAAISHQNRSTTSTACCLPAA